MRARDLEDAVLELEEVRIVIRTSSKSELGEFEYERKAAGTTTVSEWLQQRIIPLLDGNEVAVVNGRGETPNGRTRMDNLRASYIE